MCPSSAIGRWVAHVPTFVVGALACIEYSAWDGHARCRAFKIPYHAVICSPAATLATFLLRQQDMDTCEILQMLTMFVQLAKGAAASETYLIS